MNDLCKIVDLMKYLPIYWHDVKEMQEIQKTLGIEIGKLNCHMDDVHNQCYIDTATWGLSLWEKELALEINPNISYEQRREIIKAKLRGAGTATIEYIKNVAVAYSNGEVEVVEHNDKYYIEIKFVGVHGIPANMAGLKKILSEIIPAHLGIEYVYTFSVWGHLLPLTWETFKFNGMNWFDAKNTDMNSYVLWGDMKDRTYENEERTWQSLNDIDIYRN